MYVVQVFINKYLYCITPLDSEVISCIALDPGTRVFREAIEGFHVTSQQPNRASHTIHSRHVGSFFALSGIGKSHKMCSHSLLLNLHEAKLHHSNNVINIYSLTGSLTCSNNISKKLKHILLFFPGSRFFLYRAMQKNIQHGVGTKGARGAYRVKKTLYTHIPWWWHNLTFANKGGGGGLKWLS